MGERRFAVQMLVVSVLVWSAPTPSFAQAFPVWDIVRFKCLRHLTKSEAPIPCDSVDVTAGWDRGVAYLKAPIGPARMLAIPTHEVKGIEDPTLLQEGEPNYFAIDWQVHGALDSRLGAHAAETPIAIAVDARPARDQDQLTLVADCLDKDAAKTLFGQAASLDESWRRLATPIKGRPYWARRLDEASLKAQSPFRRLAGEIPGAKDDMGDWSIALAAARGDGKPVLILLADRAEGAEGGRPSSLLDPECAIATQ